MDVSVDQGWMKLQQDTTLDSNDPVTGLVKEIASEARFDSITGAFIMEGTMDFHSLNFETSAQQWGDASVHDQARREKRALRPFLISTRSSFSPELQQSCGRGNGYPVWGWGESASAPNNRAKVVPPRRMRHGDISFWPPIHTCSLK